MPAVSVILPVYNVAPWLPPCLESIAAQTFRDYQLILVDDGSTDESGSLCDEWAARDPQCLVIHQKNKGLSGARNAGLEKAVGEYIAFVDTDDLILPRYLELLYNACLTTGAKMSICAVEDVSEEGTPLSQPVLTSPIQAGVFSGKELLETFYTPQSTYYTVAWNKLYHRSLWEDLRYPLGKIHEDDAVAHRLFLECDRVACLDQVLYYYRLRQGSICRTQLKPSAFDSVEALLDRYGYFVSRQVDPSLQAQAAAACWRRYLQLCSQVAAQPSSALWARLEDCRKAMKEIPTSGLSLREKATALRWSRFPVSKKELS